MQPKLANPGSVVGLASPPTASLIGDVHENHPSKLMLRLAPVVPTQALTPEFAPPASDAPAALFRISCYEHA